MPDRTRHAGAVTDANQQNLGTLGVRKQLLRISEISNSNLILKVLHLSLQVGSRFLGGYSLFDLEVFKNVSVNQWEFGALMSYVPVSICKHLNT